MKGNKLKTQAGCETSAERLECIASLYLPNTYPTPRYTPILLFTLQTLPGFFCGPIFAGFDNLPRKRRYSNRCGMLFFRVNGNMAGWIDDTHFACAWAYVFSQALIYPFFSGYRKLLLWLESSIYLCVSLSVSVCLSEWPMQRVTFPCFCFCFWNRAEASGLRMITSHHVPMTKMKALPDLL